MLLKSEKINFISLVTVQGFNAIIPLVAFPYAYSLFGEKIFSDVVIGESLSLIILALVIYSFEVLGINKVVKKEEGAYFCVLFCRLCLYMLSVILIYIIVQFITPRLSEYFLAWALYPLGYILYSAYYFVAKKDNFFHAVCIAISRLMTLILLAFFGNDFNSGVVFVLIISVPYCLGGLICTIYVMTHYGEKLIVPKSKKMYQYLVEGRFIFIGNLSVSIYRDYNVLYLGMLSMPPSVVAVYAIIEKWIKCLQAVIRPINQYFYADLVKVVCNFSHPSFESYEKLKLKAKLQIGMVLFVIVLSCLFFTFLYMSGFYIGIQVGKMEYIALIIMTGSIFFGVKNFIFGVIGLNNLNQDKVMAKNVLVVGFCHVWVFALLSSTLGLLGAAIGFILSEMMLFTLIRKQYGNASDL
ncbi:oligosaccharide flippase family protein [Vibrio cyclitrophicus]|uniref:oligosaccharide flippase family protein n=1 Tax=Vibrio cyclitrophicus TaxID=47951 RepID=UPI000313BA74|nr:oligosaccharide flippase family protein [Vibrio cyclitrophicus]